MGKQHRSCGNSLYIVGFETLQVAVILQNNCGVSILILTSMHRLSTSREVIKTVVSNMDKNYLRKSCLVRLLSAAVWMSSVIRVIMMLNKKMTNYFKKREVRAPDSGVSDQQTEGSSPQSW